MGILDPETQIFIGEDGGHYIRLPGGDSAKIVMERQEIHLEVVEAKGLPQMDVGAGVSKEDRARGVGVSADPFVVVSLGAVSRKTDVVRDSLNPTFSFTATFILAEASDERAEISRKLSDMSEIKLRVEDWDEDGSPDFIGLATLPVAELAKKDPMGRFQFIDLWLPLMLEDGAEPRVRPDGSAGLGAIHIRGALRAGKQVEVFNRVRGPVWLEPNKIVEVLEQVPSLFCWGDRQVVDILIELINRRTFEPPTFEKDHVRMLAESGVPLGSVVSRMESLSTSEEPMGRTLIGMVKKGVPFDLLKAHDPRDVYHNAMRTHWIARAAAVGALGQLTFRGHREAVDAITGTAIDEVAQVREESARVLSFLAPVGDEEVMSLMVQLLEDDYPAVRRRAVECLSAVATRNHPRTIIEVCELLDDHRDFIRQAGMSALRVLVTPDGCKLASVEVCARLESPWPGVRFVALEAIKALVPRGDKVALAEVVNRLQHPLHAVRIIALKAVAAVAKRGDKFAIAAAGNLLEHPDFDVRAAAAAAIETIAPPGDLAAIQAVAKRLGVGSDHPMVMEGARFVSAPTTGAPTGWRDLDTMALSTVNSTADPIHILSLQTPRLSKLMPITRESAVAYHVPILPSDQKMPSIAHQWWRDKHAKDTNRHRFHYGGEDSRLGTGHPTSPSHRGNTGGTESQRQTTAGQLSEEDGERTQASPGTLSPGSPTSPRSPINALLKSPLTRGTPGQGSKPSKKVGDKNGGVSVFFVDDPHDMSMVMSTKGGQSMRVESPTRSKFVQSSSGQSSKPSVTGGSKRLALKTAFLQAARSLVVEVIEELLGDQPSVEKNAGASQASQSYQFPNSSVFYDNLIRLFGEHPDVKTLFNWDVVFQTDPRPREGYDFELIRQILTFNPTLQSNLVEAKKLILAKQRGFGAGDSKPPPAHLGILHIKVVEAKGLPQMERFGSVDPFVSLEVPGRDAIKTLVRADSPAPEWLQDKQIEITQDLMKEKHERRATAEVALFQDFDEDQDPEDDAEETREDEGDGTPASEQEWISGLYFDIKLTLPVTNKELQGADLATFLDRIRNLAGRESKSDVCVLSKVQKKSREREMVLRIRTGDCFETMNMADLLSQEMLRADMVESKLLDEFRVQLIKTENITTVATLLEVSMPLVVALRHFRLGKDAVEIGRATLPIGPVVHSLASGVIDDWFEVRDERGRSVRSDAGWRADGSWGGLGQRDEDGRPLTASEIRLQTAGSEGEGPRGSTPGSRPPSRLQTPGSRLGTQSTQQSVSERPESSAGVSRQGSDTPASGPSRPATGIPVARVRLQLWFDKAKPVLIANKPSSHLDPALPSERVRAMLSASIRANAAELLFKVRGTRVEELQKEVLLAAATSIDGQAAAIEALRQTAFSGHAGTVTCLVWLQDGERLVSCGEYGQMKVWNARNGSLERTIFTNKGGLLAIGLLATHEDVVVTTHSDGSIALWNVDTGEELVSRRIDGPPAGALDVSHNSSHLVTVDVDTRRGEEASYSLRLWCLLQPPMPHQARACAALEPEHRKLAKLLASCHYPFTVLEHLPPPAYVRALPLLERIILMGASADLAAKHLPGPLSEPALPHAEKALERVYSDLASGEPLDYPVWMRSLVMRVQRELRQLGIAHRTTLSTHDKKGPPLASKRTQSMRSVKFDPSDAESFAVGCEDGAIRFFTAHGFALKTEAAPRGLGLGGVLSIDLTDASKGARAPPKTSATGSIKAHTTAVVDMCWHDHPSSNIIFSAATCVKCWNLTDGECLGSFAIYRGGKPTSIHVSPDPTLTPLAFDPPAKRYTAHRGEDDEKGAGSSRRRSHGRPPEVPPGGSVLVVGTSKGKVGIWRLAFRPSKSHPGAMDMAKVWMHVLTCHHMAVTQVSLPPFHLHREDEEEESETEWKKEVERLPANRFTRREKTRLGASCSFDKSITVFDIERGVLVRKLNSDPDPLGERLAVWPKSLAESLDDPNPNVRKAVCAALATMCGPNDGNAVRAVATKLRTKDVQIRKEVVDTLRWMVGKGFGWEAEEAKAAVASMLAVSDKSVRTSAHEVLLMVVKNAEEAHAYKLMLRQLDRAREDDTESIVSVTARILLQAAGGVSDSALATFLAGVDRESDNGRRLVKLASLQVLSVAVKGEDRPEIARHLEHPDKDVRVIAQAMLINFVENAKDERMVAEILSLVIPLCCRMENRNPAAAATARRTIAEVILAQAGFAEERDLF